MWSQTYNRRKCHAVRKLDYKELEKIFNRKIKKAIAEGASDFLSFVDYSSLHLPPLTRTEVDSFSVIHRVTCRVLGSLDIWRKGVVQDGTWLPPALLGWSSLLTQWAASPLIWGHQGAWPWSYNLSHSGPHSSLSSSSSPYPQTEGFMEVTLNIITYILLREGLLEKKSSEDVEECFGAGKPWRRSGSKSESIPPL